MSSRLPAASRIARGLARASVAREVGVGHGTVERIARQMDRPFEATAAGLGGFCKLERIPVTWKRSLHVGSNWCILAG